MAQTSHEIDFLPAALEIQDRPPSPIGRAIVWAIIVFFLIAVIWSMLGHVDIVATAQGKIVPSDRVKLIQPKELGVVRAIHVSEGQAVKAGDILIELDPTDTEADKSRLESELATSLQDNARLTGLNLLLASEAASVEALTDLQADFTTRARLQAEWSSYTAQQAALKNTVISREAELASIQENIKKLQGTLPLITKRANATKSIVEKQLASEAVWLELEQERIEQQQDLAAFKEQKKSLQAAIQEAKEQQQVAKTEYQSKILAQLTENQLTIQRIEQELTKASSRNELQQLRAPIDGVVQQLAVHTIGGVVTPAQELMKVVPQGAALEVEAWLENKDIGFVSEGQTAEIKIETFPFTKYGVIDAEVLDVSNDAVSDEDKGLVYAARVLMKESVIKVNDKLVNLSPGMAVTVEVKTGTRRLIEYVLTPLLRYRDEGLKER